MLARRPLVLLLAVPLAAACKSGDPAASPADAGAAAVDSCGVLFGNPNPLSGLDSTQCQPRCACRDAPFEPPAYDAAFIQSLVDDWALVTPYPPLTSDPYAGPPPTADPDGTVCAVVAQGDAGAKPRPYALVTFPSEDAARAAGGSVTHFGRCGLCSTLANLAVYMRENDLTAPVRACGLEPNEDGGNADVDCLTKLGFDLPCAQIWAYDTAHTRDACIGTCFAHAGDPYNQPDGALNPCIECDEVQSGPVFKAVAGRTRRNSGLPNAICRPCSEVQALVHDY
jgi:hypothetical protein